VARTHSALLVAVSMAEAEAFARLIDARLRIRRSR
jgi:hypothetical protein